MSRQYSTDYDHPDLNERQVAALPYFATSDTCIQACKNAGIHRATYFLWMKEPAFADAVRNVRNSIVQESVDMLKGAATEAVSKLLELMRNGDSHKVQRDCANDLLDHLAKWKTNEEFEARIAAIEAYTKGVAKAIPKEEG